MATPRHREYTTDRVPRLIFAGLLIWCITKSLWLSDDSLITSRVILNFFSGHGLVYNVGERVQAYTHPLWLALGTVCSLLIGNTNTGFLLLSLACCTLTIIIAGKLLDRSVGLCLFCALWILTPAVLEYSSSGLENPLGYLFIILSLLNIRREHTRLAIACLSVLPLIRLDYTLISLPLSLSTIYLDYRGNRAPEKLPTFRFRQLGIYIAATFLPTCVYLMASKIYYGYYLPNTFWAKSGTGLKTFAATQERIQQGLFYISSALQQSPTAPILFAFTLYLLASEIARHRTRRAAPNSYTQICDATRDLSRNKNGQRLRELHILNAIHISVGISSLLYIAYTIYIGGDFMDGRFMSIPLFLMITNSCLALNYASSRFNTEFKSSLIYTISAVIIVAFIFNTKLPISFADNGPLKDPSSLVNQFGIADERAYYITSRGLYGLDLEVFQAGSIHNARKHLGNLDKTRYRSEPIVMCGGLGRSGMVYLYIYHIDECALTDAFLSRIQHEQGSRIGHFKRAIPEGYIESVKNQQNLIPSKEYKDLLESVWREIKQ